MWLLYSPVCVGPQVGNPEDRFSHGTAHLIISTEIFLDIRKFKNLMNFSVSFGFN